jgi:hypothetical protein
MLKYRNVRTKLDGYTFDSKAEAARYAVLKIRQQAGEIEQLKVHPRYEIMVPMFESYMTVPICTYVADFEYVERIKGEWTRIVEDVKGVRTAAYRIKRKLFEVRYPYLTFVEIGKQKGKRGRTRKRG